jgi:hypothetical protein
MIRRNNDKTPYDIGNGILENVNHFREFEIKCYIKIEDGKIGKFDS